MGMFLYTTYFRHHCLPVLIKMDWSILSEYGEPRFLLLAKNMCTKVILSYRLSRNGQKKIPQWHSVSSKVIKGARKCLLTIIRINYGKMISNSQVLQSSAVLTGNRNVLVIHNITYTRTQRNNQSLDIHIWIDNRTLITPDWKIHLFMEHNFSAMWTSPYHSTGVNSHV